MRISYQDGRLFLSMTKSEIEYVHENTGMAVEIPIGNLKVLHEDISKAVLQHWTTIEVKQEVERLKRTATKS